MTAKDEAKDEEEAPRLIHQQHLGSCLLGYWGWSERIADVVFLKNTGYKITKNQDPWSIH